MPPGCVKISANFYADKGELTNIGYREYQYWIKRLFGKESDAFQQTIIDTSVWNQIEEFSSLSENYYRDHKYANHPVVGITLKQAKLYTTWRTDRVVESTLIKAGIIGHDPFQTSKDYFTFEKFLNGEYVHIKGSTEYKDKPFVLDYPSYKIPTSKEWELISGIKNDDEIPYQYRRHNKKIIKEYGHLHNTKEFNNSVRNISKEDLAGKNMITSISYSFGQNKFGMYGIIGNVSELIDQEGSSKGENWTSSKHDFTKEKINKFTKPNCWTGFRNVCYVKRIEIKDGRK